MVYFAKNRPLKLSTKSELQQARVTKKVARKSDWLAGWFGYSNVTVMDTLIGSGLCLETKAGSDRSLLSQGAPVIDSVSPLLVSMVIQMQPQSVPLPAPPSSATIFFSTR